MNLKVNEKYYVSDYQDADKSPLLEHLQEKQIYDQTLNIPFPYTPKRADEWIHYVSEETKRLGRSVNWAIRNTDNDLLVGGIGFHALDTKNPHRAEIGYWLAKPLWSRGIMTEIVRAITEYGFRELGYARITAHVFHFNVGSARVLEKAGYQREGKLRNHYLKDGKIFDGFLYAATKN